MDTEMRPGSDGSDLERLGVGLDALDSPGQPRRGGRRGWFRSAFLPGAAAVATLLVCWQVVVVMGVQPRYILPSPLDVASEFLDLARSGALVDALWTSLSRAVPGFVASVLIGTVLGLAIARIRVARTALGPIVSALQAMPAVAWVPAGIVWFGISSTTIYAVVLIGAVPSVANGLVAGVDQIPEPLLRAARNLGADGWAMNRYVILPAAIPGYLAGLRQGWAFAWRSLMAAELIAYSPKLGIGIGQLLYQGSQLFDMPTVIVAMLLVLLVGVAVELLVFKPLERRALSVRGLVGN